MNLDCRNAKRFFACVDRFKPFRCLSIANSGLLICFCLVGLFLRPSTLLPLYDRSSDRSASIGYLGWLCVPTSKDLQPDLLGSCC